MEKAKSFKDLVVWQKAHQLVLEVYKLTGTFSDSERFGLISQMRRAAVSLAANIAEGFAKIGKRDKINFYNIAQGSLGELNYYLILSKDLGYCENNRKILQFSEEVGKMLNSLINSIAKS
ncbi:four helix bundle protein [candidate division WOR-3 bacterium]|nr:four helix bundle protein [candidate division WOR-3 bacterium]